VRRRGTHNARQTRADHQADGSEGAGLAQRRASSDGIAVMRLALQSDRIDDLARRNRSPIVSVGSCLVPFVSYRNKVSARAEGDTLGEDKLKPLIYKNTLSKVNFSPPLHEAEPRGYGYEIDTHFVHFFGRASGLWVISSRFP
jgi:hypothetical protein